MDINNNNNKTQLTLMEVLTRQDGVKRCDQSRIKVIAFFTSTNCAVSRELGWGTF